MSLIENAVDFILGYALRFRLGQYLYREFGVRSSDIYPCVTCGLPYHADPAKNRVDVERMLDGNLVAADQALIDEIDDSFPIVGTFNGPQGSCCRAAWPSKS